METPFVDAVWGWRWASVAAVGLLFFTNLTNFTTVGARVLVALVVIRCMALVAWRPDHMPMGAWVPISHYSLTIAIYVVAALSVVPLIRRRREGLELGLVAFGLADAVVTIGQTVIGSGGYMLRHGVIGNASLNGTMLAMILPFAVPVRMHRAWQIVPSVVICGAALVTEGVVPTMTILSCVVTMVWGWRGIVVAMSSAVIALLAVPLNDNGRWHVQGMAWSWFRGRASNWFGEGPGSYAVYAPWIERYYAPSDSVFIWLHNDWLQILIEWGALGLLVAVGVYAYAWARAGRDRRHQAFLAALAVGMLGNYPWRHPLTALVCLSGLAVVCLHRGDLRRDKHGNPAAHYPTGFGGF